MQRQLEVVLALHKSDDKTKAARKKTKAANKAARDAAVQPATAAATVDERVQLQSEYAALRAEMGLKASPKDVIP